MVLTISKKGKLKIEMLKQRFLAFSAANNKIKFTSKGERGEIHIPYSTSSNSNRGNNFFANNIGSDSASNQKPISHNSAAAGSD